MEKTYLSNLHINS